MKYAWLLLVVLVALVVFSWPAISCGPFISEMRFTTYRHPLPGELASGRLGVLRPHYWRWDLLLAYRTLSGLPLKAGEPEPRRINVSSGTNGATAWIEARRDVPKVPPLGAIELDKTVPGSTYENFPNCLSGAFENAATTLRNRIAKWGAASPEIADWVRTQDLVFQNCHAGPVIPQELHSGDPLMIADRNYQIEAAKFYAGQLSEAESGFDKIALDKSSPWRDIAPYLAARACIRQGTIGGDQDKMQEAAKRLRAIINDPARKQWHAPAQSLLDFVRARLEPQECLTELGNQLMQPASDTQLSRILTEYTAIWDRLDMKADHTPPVDKSDVADWIATFQSGREAVSKWRSKHTVPWLIAALLWADGEDLRAQDLISAAHAIRPGTPAYASVTYYGIRNEILDGKLDAAREWVDGALATKQSAAVMNLLRSERLRLARNWTEFLTYGPRTPVASDDSTGSGEEPMPKVEGEQPAAFDDDFVQPLNTIVPLTLWLDAVNNKILPQSLRADIARAAWVRGAILRQQVAARSLAERVSQLEPTLCEQMRVYLAECDSDAANFAGALVMLRAPGLAPTLRSGFGRETPPLKHDTFRDNWWRLPDRFSSVQERSYLRNENEEPLFDLYPHAGSGPTGFLPKNQRAAGEAEWKQLDARAHNSVEFLCSVVIAWARAHPRDPRVPEALHRAVDATHYGPSDDTNSQYSKQAFDLLHRRYPNSEWTKRTKYWY